MEHYKHKHICDKHKHHCRCCIGPTGPTGQSGEQGSTGPTGQTGPTGGIMIDYVRALGNTDVSSRITKTASFYASEGDLAI